MRIAILGATSQMAQDLILSFREKDSYVLNLYARRPNVVQEWLKSVGLSHRHVVAGFEAFGTNESFDSVINFVGVGDPAKATAMGASIFSATLEYDEMALSYIRQYPECRYIFMSSGAAYGSGFKEPADENTKAAISINSLLPQDWYGVAKLHAECRHRSTPDLPIIDIRVFNYFSRTQDISARFLITDIVCAIRDKTILRTSPEYIVRDFLHPYDFHQLVSAILSSPTTNAAIDCYSKAPIDKPTLLAAMRKEFGLIYEVTGDFCTVNATGNKSHYYSLNKKAADFNYKPNFSSLEGLIQEIAAVLGLQK